MSRGDPDQSRPSTMPSNSNIASTPEEPLPSTQSQRSSARSPTDSTSHVIWKTRSIRFVGRDEALAFASSSRAQEQVANAAMTRNRYRVPPPDRKGKGKGRDTGGRSLKDRGSPSPPPRRPMRFPIPNAEGEKSDASSTAQQKAETAEKAEENRRARERLKSSAREFKSEFAERLRKQVTKRVERERREAAVKGADRDSGAQAGQEEAPGPAPPVDEVEEGIEEKTAAVAHEGYTAVDEDPVVEEEDPAKSRSGDETQQPAQDPFIDKGDAAIYTFGQNSQPTSSRNPNSELFIPATYTVEPNSQPVSLDATSDIFIPTQADVAGEAALPRPQQTSEFSAEHINHLLADRKGDDGFLEAFWEKLYGKQDVVFPSNPERIPNLPLGTLHRETTHLREPSHREPIPPLSYYDFSRPIISIRPFRPVQVPTQIQRPYHPIHDLQRGSTPLPPLLPPSRSWE